jgi:predicted transcriptional regulator of viral defense system
VTPRSQTLLEFFKEHGNVARFSAILKAGFHPDILTQLQKENKIEKISHGLYRLMDSSPFSDPDLITTALQVPKGIICLISALSFHQATLEIPKHIDIAIPEGARSNRIKYPPIKFYKFSPIAWKAGIEEHSIDGHKVRVYSLAKTVADCFKFRNKIGQDVALEALKECRAKKRCKIDEIMKYARINRVEKVMKPYLEAII